MDFTEQELAHMVADYQQRLADATHQAVQATAKLATVQARVAELEADTKPAT